MAGDIEMFTYYPTVKKVDPPGTPPMNFPKSYQSVEEGREKIVQHIISIGGVDGIVGFSQGASMAILSAEQHERINSACPARPLKWVALFGSGPTVFRSRGREMDAGVAAGLRVFLCTGDADKTAAHSSAEGAPKGESLRQMTARLKHGGATVYAEAWEGTHRMPPAKHKVYTALKGFLTGKLEPM
jgi:hypothetical protein